MKFLITVLVLLQKKYLPTINGFLIGILTIFLLNPNIEIFFGRIPSTLIFLFSSISCLILFYGILKTKCIIDPFGVFIAFIILLFSNTLNKPYNLIQGPIIKGEIILFSVIIFSFFKNLKFFYFLLLLSPIFLFSIFFYESQLGLVWSDDNPTFIYRLELLKRFFPNIPFFYTGWNAGLDARDFFATGALNVFLLSYPLVKFLDLSKYYNIILSYLLFFLLPLFTIISCKILKKDWTFISIATALSMTTNLFWYRWALKYGTLGFITSSCLVPIVFTLSQKLLSKDENLSKNEAWALVLSTSLMLLWSPTGLVFIPCIIYAMLFLLRILKKKYCKRIILGLFLINLPWICIFWSASNVSNFLVMDKATNQTIVQEKQNNFKTSNQQKITLQKTLKNFRDTFTAMNPLITLFAMIGICFLPISYKKLFLITSIWLFFLGTMIAQIKPQMEFDRMLLIWGILSVIPTTACIYNLLKTESLKNKIASSIMLGTLVASIFSAGSIFKNRTLEIYYHQNDSIKSLISFLKNYPSKGRILFSGFVLHHFGEGHIAPLPVLTGKQIIASSPFHNAWKYTQVIPKEFIENDKIKDYLSLMNIELIVAHEKIWRDYFFNDSSFEEVFKFNNYKIFRYKNFANSYALLGKLSNLKILENQISFTPLSKSIKLKFNFFPFLESNNCKISNEKVSNSINFIKLSHCEIGKENIIKSKNAFSRILTNGK